MATEYFGQTANNAEDNNGGARQLSWYSSKSFQCPGNPTDTVTIKELSANVYVGSGSPKIRVGIYNASGNLVCEGTALVAVTGVVTPSWQGHLTQANMTPNPCTLVGGDYYRLAVYMDNAGDCRIAYQSGGASGDVKYYINNYDSGLPTTLPTGTNWTGWWNIRCGVEVTAGGGSDTPITPGGGSITASGVVTIQDHGVVVPSAIYQG